MALFLQQHPVLLIVLVAVLVLAAIPGLFLIETSSGLDLFIDSASPTFQTYTRYQAEFGAQPLVALIESPIEEFLASPSNRQVLALFEQEIVTDPRFVNAHNPLLFLQFAISRAPEALPTVPNDPALLRQFLYGPDMEVIPLFRPVAPTPEVTLITVFPSVELSPEQTSQALRDLEAFFSENPFEAGEPIVSGEAAAFDAVNEEINRSLAILLGLALVAMVVVLSLTFRVRWRLLPLFMVLMAGLWTFGIMGYAGIPLSMATMGALPIIIGLGIDYSLQFQNRYEEELRRQGSVNEAIVASVSKISTAVGIALAAIVIGFLTLLLAPVPMVEDFGVVMIIGVVLSYLIALFLLNSILLRRDRNRELAQMKEESREASHREERALRAVNRVAVRAPLIIMLLAVALFVFGVVVDSRLPVETDWERLMPQDIPELQQIRTIRETTGNTGQVHFLIEGDSLLRPEVLAWMHEYSQMQVQAQPDVLAAGSPAEIIYAATEGMVPPDTQQIEQIFLASAPESVRKQMVNQERTMAVITFNFPPLSLEELHDVVVEMEEDLAPPPGLVVTPTGSLIIGTETIDAIVESRVPIMIAGVLGVFFALLVILRSLRRALFALVPMILVIGWASAGMWVFGLPINPLTAVLSGIIIGISTEYAVLLLERYHEELKEGRSPAQAMLTGSSNLGRAIVASSLTTLGGFAVLIYSDFSLVRDFGYVTVMIVFMALVSVLIVLPPLVVWFDNWWLKRRGR